MQNQRETRYRPAQIENMIYHRTPGQKKKKINVCSNCMLLCAVGEENVIAIPCFRILKAVPFLQQDT